MSRTGSWMACALGTLALTGAAPEAADRDVGPLVRALWLVQRHGTPAALDPRSDEHVKATLARSLGKGHVLTQGGTDGLFAPSTFDRLAGSDGKLDSEEVRMALGSEVPASRTRLLSPVAAYADYLTTTLDRIDAPHRDAGDRLVAWLVRDHQPGRPLHVTVICTGNSRRSILGATMGNVAAAYYGMPEIRFHSGGTAPTAFNARTAGALREVGIMVEPTGREAPRGDATVPNPIYGVRWGGPDDPALEATEFSKAYADPTNPQSGFAALMVCSEADAGCPVVKGAGVRIAMPYLDPKIFDDGAFEAAKYAERRDDMGRLMLSVMMRVRNQLDRERTTR